MIDHVLTLLRADNGWIVVRPSDHETGEPETLTFEGDNADALQRALYCGLDGYTQTKRGGGVEIIAHEHGWEHEEDQA
jgi:hypothetical protein